MNHSDLRRRTTAFALSALHLAKQGRRDPMTDDAWRQLVRATASVAANYRAAGLARSRKEFISSANAADQKGLAALQQECQELIRIFQAARNTARRNSAGAN